MGFLSRYRRPLLILSLTAAADVTGRILLKFDMIHVSAMEAVLFSLAALALGLAARRDRLNDRVRRTDLVLAALLGLAAIRALVWAASGSVLAANVTLLVAGTVATGWLWIRSRPPRAAG